MKQNGWKDVCKTRPRRSASVYFAGPGRVATWERRNRTAVIVSGRLHGVRHVVRQEAKLLFIAARNFRLRPIDGGTFVQGAKLGSKVRLGEAICKDGGPWAAV